MDPKLVVRSGRPPVDDQTPLQKRGFAIVDGYIEQNIPADLLYRHKSAHRLPNHVSSADDLVTYQLIIKNQFGYVVLEGWETGETPTARRLPPGQIGDDLVHELMRQELIFLENIGEGGEELPLTESDLKAIGIENSSETKDEVTNGTIDEPDEAGTQFSIGKPTG